MLFVYLWIYTFLLAILWWLFIVAKIHSYKFKNFSNNIVKVTNFLLVILTILSLLGYILIVFWSSNTNWVKNTSKYINSNINY